MRKTTTTNDPAVALASVGNFLSSVAPGRRLALALVFGLANGLVGGGCAADASGTAEPEPTPSPEGMRAVAWDLRGPVSDLVDGAEVPWVWGFQGGTMIRPQFLFPADTAVEIGDTADIRIRHLEVAGEPSPIEDGFEEGTFIVEVWNDGSGLVVGPFDDQLAWTPISDTVVAIEATIETDAETHVIEAAVSLYDGADGDPPHPCEEFGELSPTNCSYVPLPGVINITAIVDDENAAGCNDPIQVRGAFVPDGDVARAIERCHVESLAYAEDAFEQERGAEHPTIERACAAGLGVEVGNQLEATYVVAVTGTCNPTPSLVIATDLTACACQ